jgi:hypothetical protein
MGHCKAILSSPGDIEPDKVLTEDPVSMKTKFRYTLLICRLQITIYHPCCFEIKLTKHGKQRNYTIKCKRTHLARIANAELPSYFGVQLLSMIIAIQGKAAVSLMTRDMCIGGRLIFSINVGSALLETVPVSG